MSSVTYALGFSLWKRPHVRAFLHNRHVVFIRHPAQLPASAEFEVATWGMRYADSELPKSVRLLRLEDGFIRSVGLGAALTRPLSWVCDDLGIYYNCQTPSRLERVLSEGVFTQELKARAANLREQLKAARVTKYNVGKSSWTRPTNKNRVLLVPGQVESDASIRYGAGDLRTNMGLLKEVRRRAPDAFVIYKPHPDVAAGLRALGVDESQAKWHCDAVLDDVSMSELLDEVDEVHTMTSLTGFEALLRGKRVVVYGMPFYSGWGLTEDIGMSSVVGVRRARRLDLDELVAGALILYPTYVSAKTGEITSPEMVLEELKEWKQREPRQSRLWRVVLQWLLGFRKY